MKTDFKIETLLAGDNFIHILRSADSMAVVDPGTARPVLAYAEKSCLKIETILLTHGHSDHTAGCAELERETGCIVIGPPSCARLAIGDGERVQVCGIGFQAIATPGHTHDHLCFYSSGAQTLFTGDTLFYGGCGRVFTGDFDGMWRSLERLRALPGQTQIFCGHDYTAENLAFARSVDPDNEILESSDPNPRCSSIENEVNINPFLRADSDMIRKNIALPNAPAVEVFRRLRQMKDVFNP